MQKFQTESISRYINYLHRQGVSTLCNSYKHYNLGAGQYQFLVYLFVKDGITHEELTDKIGVDKATTTRALKKLDDCGYITKVCDSKDKRKQYIYLTDYAKSNKDKILQIARDWESHLVEELSEEELEQLYVLLRKMTQNSLVQDFTQETF
ncbi:MAG: MarR family winged helix-turn-helix transcriptional regulator [bacterium]|nr:MarR family winged helix-turn-helix transcriptional regulator [bacterium]